MLNLLKDIYRELLVNYLMCVEGFDYRQMVGVIN